MKGTILYSSMTGNTAKLAEELHKNLQAKGEWTLHNIKDGTIDLASSEVVLFGGWAEGGSFNKAALKCLESLDLKGKKLGLFMTMGSRTATEHGRMCAANLGKILENYDGIGIQTLQGYIAPALMEKLMSLPETAIPQSVKEAMEDGVATYQEPTAEEYKTIADFFAKQL